MDLQDASSGDDDHNNQIKIKIPKNLKQNIKSIKFDGALQKD